jgi:predicted nucleic acid-binding protein
MALTRQTPLFVDASCLNAAAGRPSGGAGFLVSLCQRGILTGIVSPAVLAEAARNIVDKLPPEAWGRYDWMLSRVPFIVVPVPPSEAVRRWADSVTAKDARIMAAAPAAGAEYLLTLDQPLAKRVNATGQPLRALSPGEFIREILPQHTDYVREDERGG